MLYNGISITSSDILRGTVEQREALLPDLVRFFLAAPALTRFTWFGADEARAVLGLNGRDWQGDPHPVLDDLVTAIEAGTFSLSEPTPSEGKADREATGNALAVMRRREAQAIADRAQTVRDLIEARQEAARLREQAQAVTPWGPDHPDWLPFWLQAARDAEAAGNCSEYDRHAAEMGAPSRQWFREQGTSLEPVPTTFDHCLSVTVSVTLHVHVSGPEDGPDEDDVVQAIRDNGSIVYNGDRLDFDEDVSFDVQASDPVDDGESVVTWVNPAGTDRYSTRGW